jgi:hypothetical protein
MHSLLPEKDAVTFVPYSRSSKTVQKLPARAAAPPGLGRSAKGSVNFGRENEIVLVQAFYLFGLKGDLHISPAETEVRMVAVLFRQFSYLIDKIPGFSKISKLELPFDAV